MKKTLFYSLAVITLGLSSCTNEELVKMQAGKKDVMTVIAPNVEARTTMNRNTVLWSEGDKISIFAENEASYVNNEYILSKGENTNTAEFSSVGAASGTTKVAAMYPYVSTATYANSGINFTTDGKHAYDSDTDNNEAFMAAVIDADKQDNIAFKHAGALIDLTINNIPNQYTSVELTSNGDNAPSISGESTITFEGNKPTWKVMGSGKTVKITFTASALSNKRFYFPIPAGTYPSLKVELKDDNGGSLLLKEFTNSGTGNTISAGERLYATLTLDVVTGSLPTTAPTASAAEEALDESNSVVVQDITSGNSTISVPEKSGDAAVSIAIDKITATTETITVKASETTDSNDDTNTPSDVTVAIPNVEGGAKMEVSLPTSTVTVTPNGASSTISELTAETSENTLVLAPGITVNKMIVKKGNIRVKKGATIGNIVKEGADAPETVYIYNEGGTVPEKLDEGFILVNSIVNATQDKMYDSISDAITDAASGDVIELPEGTYTFPEAKNMTLTFIGTGKVENIKITVPYSGKELDGSTITFKNLTIESSLANYYRFIRMEGTYQNCIINNQYHLGGDSSFDNCTFNVSSKDWYNIWTYGYDATFTKCTFNCEGKSVLVYNDANQTDDTVTFDSCIFNDNGGENGVAKAAIEAAAYAKTDRHTLRINNCTVNGFATTEQNATTYGGTDLGTNVWGNKNLMTSENLKVYINNELVGHKAAITDE